jgi:phosphatidate cytidylyltransferase
MMSKKKSYYFLGLIFLIFSFYTVYELRNISEDISLSLFLFIALICVSTDIGGYIFGKIFKGPKLIKLSPNKTYSGMIGGYLLSIIFANFFIEYTYVFGLNDI